MPEQERPQTLGEFMAFTRADGAKAPARAQPHTEHRASRAFPEPTQGWVDASERMPAGLEVAAR